MSEVTSVILPVSMNALKELITDAVAGAFQERTVARPKEDQDEIMTIQQASKFLNLTVSTIYGFTSSRKIPFLKPGKKVFFKKSELNEWRMRGEMPMVDNKLNQTVDEQLSKVRKRKK